PAPSRRSRAVSSDARHRRHGTEHDVLQLDVRRPAPTRRSGRSRRVPRRLPRQSSHTPSRRCRATRRTPLHSLRRLPQCLPDLQKHRGPRLRNHLSRPGRLRHHTAFPRPSKLETSERRIVALRRLHRGLPGEDRYPSPSPPQPPERDEGEARETREAHVEGLCLVHESAPPLRLRDKVHALAARTAPARESVSPRSRRVVDQGTRLPGCSAEELARAGGGTTAEGGRKMSGERAAIFARIREALKEPAPRHHEDHAPVPAASSVTAPFRDALAQVGPTLDDRIALFAKLSEMLKTEFVVCTNIEAAAKHLTHVAQESGWK